MALNCIRPAGQAGFRDKFETKADQWMSAWNGDERFDIGFLGAPLSKTSISHSGAFLFPQTVRAALAACNTYHLDFDVDLAEHLVARDLGDIEMHATDLRRCHDNIHQAVSGLYGVYPDTLMFLVGGDHSITAQSIRGIAEHVDRPIGIVHFDAHHDMRNLEDGGPTNGTPFRSLLEQRVIEGTRVAQIGLRNFTNAKAYTTYAREHGVTLYSMRSVVERGLSQVIAEALATVGQGDAFIYVSFDMDVLDQAHAPGVPAPSPGGLMPWDAFRAMEELGAHRQVKAFDWVCADPTVDTRNLTSRVAAHLLLHASAGVTQRQQDG